MTVAEIVCILHLNGWALGGSDEAFPLLSSASTLFFSGGGATLATLATVLTHYLVNSQLWRTRPLKLKQIESTANQGVTSFAVALPWHTADQSIAHREPQPVLQPVKAGFSTFFAGN